jgi:hypothetical protein
MPRKALSKNDERMIVALIKSGLWVQAARALYAFDTVGDRGPTPTDEDVCDWILGRGRFRASPAQTKGRA